MNFSRIKRKRVRPLLGTYVEITLSASAPEALIDTWMTTAFEAIEEIDRLMSLYRSDSDISRLNKAKPGLRVKLHRHTTKVLQAANKLYRDSEGVFDIRCNRGALDL